MVSVQLTSIFGLSSTETNLIVANFQASLSAFFEPKGKKKIRSIFLSFDVTLFTILHFRPRKTSSVMWKIEIFYWNKEKHPKNSTIRRVEPSKRWLIEKVDGTLKCQTKWITNNNNENTQTASVPMIASRSSFDCHWTATGLPGKTYSHGVDSSPRPRHKPMHSQQQFA